MILNPDSTHQRQQPQLVALTGFMGAGKSTVGRALASALDWSFLDLDDELERLQQLRIRDLFRSVGEARFREIESATLKSVLDDIAYNTVIALGGGTFIQPANVDLLAARRARVVFLDTPVEELLQRCLVSASPDENLRPLATDTEAFRKLFEQRLPRYRTAHLMVATSGKTANQIAQEIVLAL